MRWGLGRTLPAIVVSPGALLLPTNVAWSIAELGLLVLLLGLSAFFSSSEVAFMSSNKIKLRRLRDDGSEEARIVLELLEKPEELLSVILIGNNLVNVAAASIATDLSIRAFGSLGVGLATGVITFLLLTFGEITPKAYAVKNPEKFVMRISRVMRILVTTLNPVAVFLAWVSDYILKRLGLEVKRRKSLITEEEIEYLLRVGEEEGVLSGDERKLMSNVMRFMDLPVTSAMIPKDHLVMFNVDSKVGGVLEVFRKTGHSRYPLYDGSEDNVVGMLHVKDLLRSGVRGGDEVRHVMRRIIKVPPTTKLYDVLKMMREKKTHMAVVVSGGELLGAVTLETLLEEIVGEIRDEYD